jgi:hypothetical protein
VRRARPAAPYARALGSETTSVSTRRGPRRSGRDRRRARAVLHLLDRHEAPGDAVDDDLRDAAGRGADDGGAARHGLEVHDAERLVHARAHERGGRRQDRAELVALQELVDPTARGVTHETSAMICGVCGPQRTICTEGRLAGSRCRVMRPTNTTEAVRVDAVRSRSA